MRSNIDGSIGEDEQNLRLRAVTLTVLSGIGEHPPLQHNENKIDFCKHFIHIRKPQTKRSQNDETFPKPCPKLQLPVSLSPKNRGARG